MDYRTPLSPEAAAELDAAAAHYTDRLDLDAIAAREQAATPGPWEALTTHGDQQSAPRWVVDAPSEQVIEAACTFQHGKNLEFIAHARSDVPALLGEVRRLTAEREDTCRTLRALLADPGDDLSGADLGELLEMAQASIHGLQVRADTNRAWAEDYRAERDQARAELEDARRDERARCAAALDTKARVLREFGATRAAGDYDDAAAVLRALPDAYETAMRTNPEHRPVKECADGDPHQPHPWDDFHGTARHCPGEPARTTTEET